MQGEHSNEEKLTLEARIKELTEHLEERQQAHTLLNAQLKRLQDDIRRAKRDLEKSNQEMSGLTVSMNEGRCVNKAIYSSYSSLNGDNVIISMGQTSCL